MRKVATNIISIKAASCAITAAAWFARTVGPAESLVGNGNTGIRAEDVVVWREMFGAPGDAALSRQTRAHVLDVRHGFVENRRGIVRVRLAGGNSQILPLIAAEIVRHVHDLPDVVTRMRQ